MLLFNFELLTCRVFNHKLNKDFSFFQISNISASTIEEADGAKFQISKDTAAVIELIVKEEVRTKLAAQSKSHND